MGSCSSTSTSSTSTSTTSTSSTSSPIASFWTPTENEAIRRGMLEFGVVRTTKAFRESIKDDTFQKIHDKYKKVFEVQKRTREALVERWITMKRNHGGLKNALTFNYTSIALLTDTEVRADLSAPPAPTVPIRPSEPTGPESIGIVKSSSGSKSRKKSPIPKTLKRLVWNTYVGESVGKSKCYCCKSADVYQIEFHCGHVESESEGGLTVLENLRPICSQCNLSMGTTNMHTFMRTYGFMTSSGSSTSTGSGSE